MRRPTRARDASRNTAGSNPRKGNRGAGSVRGPSGTVCCRRKRWPYLSPRAALLANVPLEVIAKVFDSGLQRVRRAGRERAEGVPGGPHGRLRGELVEITG